MKFTRLLIASLAVAALLSGCGSSTSIPTNVAPSLDTSPPTAPSGLGMVVSENSSVLSWAASADPDIAGFDIYLYSPSPDRDNSYLKIASTSGAGSSFSIPSVWADESNYFRVVAVDAAGNTSGMSNPILAMNDVVGGTAPPPTQDPTEPVMKRP